MLLTKEQIKSSISIDENTGLYEIKLPGIKRQFEAIYYSYEGVNKYYGGLVDKFIGKDLKNKLILISIFNNSYIICFVDLNNLESSYYFVDSFDFIEFDLSGEKYNCFIYNDFKNKKGFINSYNENEFICEILDEKFVIKNSIFESEVFSQKIDLGNKVKDKKINILKEDKELKYLDIADFFIYDDYFINSIDKNYNDFYNFIYDLDNKNILGNNDLKYKLKITKYTDTYYPKIKINLSILTKNIEKFSLNDFNKLLLSFFGENIVCYLFDNKKIKEEFNYYNNFTNLKLEDIDIDFKLPENIYENDIKFDGFKIDLLKLRYNLFLLREAYNIKKIDKINGTNEYNKVVKNRLEIDLINLETTISSYEKMLGRLLENIKNKL